MKCFKLLLLLSLYLFSCQSKDERASNTATSPSDKTAFFEKLDSIQIYHLGNPVVHDLDPVSRKVLFMENNAYGRGEEIFVADFGGDILGSFIKDGDTRDTYGHIMAPLVIDGENSFMAYAGF